MVPGFPEFRSVPPSVGLIAPARYFPFASGRYEVSPGLSRFGKEFGNGPADRQVFQIDREFRRYRAVKLAGRHECFDRYICESRLSNPVRTAVVSFVAQRLMREHPDYFQRAVHGDHEGLYCSLTGETLRFDASMNLIEADAGVEPAYHDALDALAGQVQEDLAIVSRDAAGGHWVSFLHLCCPNHWAPAEKIGRGFAEVHAPVAGIGPINRRADTHVNTMIAAEGGLVRFAWGLGTDDELNHHPDRDRLSRARTFDPNHPRAFVRVERQTLWGLPRVGAALFTIRTYFLDCAELKREHQALRDALVAAIESMQPESIRYKGLAPWREPLLSWLRAE